MTELAEIETTIARTLAEARPEAPRQSMLLPLLHEIQEEFSHVPPSAVPLIAGALNLSRAEVHGVISFYHDFRPTPPPRHVIKLCRAESCQARGGAAIEAALSRRLGMAMGEARGDVALEPVYCLGLCAIGPNALVNERPVARIDAAAMDRIAGEVAA